MSDTKEDTVDAGTKPIDGEWFDFDNLEYNKTIKSFKNKRCTSLAKQLYENTHKGGLDKEEMDKNTEIFNNIKTDFKEDEKIDWEFWLRVINEYDKVLDFEYDKLINEIKLFGIPNEIRGLIWKTISYCESNEIKEEFSNLIKFNSIFEKSIKRDLVRTRFINLNKDKINELFQIIKCYSLYDKEVGYTQGMAFITLPLLMNLKTDETFCLLVKLMMSYGFREFYLPEMPGLKLKIYQFDRLIEDLIPDLNLHLKNQKIKSSMYAIQWFLTLFSYKFPLKMVLRIFDIVIFEGLESLLKFSINLMIVNKDELMKLEFDDLLNFLKDKIFYYYKDDNGEDEEEDEEEGEGEERFRINEFIADSLDIEILPITLNKYVKEFNEIHKLEKSRENQVKILQIDNGKIIKDIRLIESSYAILNKNHLKILNDMVNGKIEIESIQDENKTLNKEISELNERIKKLDGNKGKEFNFTSNKNELGEGLDFEIQHTIEINARVMSENQELEEQLEQLQAEYDQLSSERHGLRSGKIGSKAKKMFGNKFW